MKKNLLNLATYTFLGVSAALATAQNSSTPQFKTTPLVLSLEAGSGEYRARPEGGEVHHSGIGYIDPLGHASYSCGLNYPEQKQFPYPDFFTATWHKSYETDGILFCVYTLKDGTIYAYDSIAGGLDVDKDEHKDELLNVIVGGTGSYHDAVGILVGRAQGAGEVSSVTPTRKLPRSILKLMDGYIRIPAATPSENKTTK
jgi:hypothetical protein